MKKKITLLIAVLFSTLMTAQTVTILGNPYLGNPYPSITAAITAASNGDVILITGTHTETLSFNKNITLRGTNPVTDIIQAAASPGTGGTGTRVITVNPTAGNVTIENLTIRHGNSNAAGGGINLDKITGLVTLRNLIVTNNFTTSNGGGISFAGSNAALINSTVQNNSATLDGGAILAAPNNASAMSNIVTISQSLINANTGRNGGGIYINGNTTFGNDYKIDLNIENTTISNNAATSPSGGLGGGSIFSNSSTWTTNAGGDGVSGNVTLRLVHATVYNNTHAAAAKAGIVFNSVVTTYFSAYNSIIVANNDTAIRAINFANATTSNVVNCILGGLNVTPAVGTFLDEPSRNNTRGRTAANAGLTGTLISQGGKTQLLPIATGPVFSGVNWCTASTGISVPTVDQRGFTREGTPDAGAFELHPTTIWSGTWSNGVPTATSLALIESPYTTTSNGGGFSTNLLAILPSGSLIVNSGANLTVANQLDNNSNLGAAGFLLENNANLIQTNNVVNSGPIRMTRNTNPLLRLDYNIWSSPVLDQNLLAFSPQTLTNRFYTYNSATNLYNTVDPSTTNFAQGKGYLIRMPNNHPVSTPTIWSGTFEGAPNNGNISVSLTTSVDEEKRFNIVGNPYPSPINMASFVTANNTQITGTLYFWRKTNSTVTSNVYNTWVGGTFTATAEPFGNINPQGIIRNGQGFFVEALNETATAIVFNNTMRVENNDNQFFKNADANVANNEPATEKHRIWLNLSDATGYFYQQAISYISGGTSGVDQYDGKNISTGDMLFNSIIPNNADHFVIQSRPLPFDPNDVIPLSIKITNAGVYTISINDKDGLFADGTQAIFLRDNLENTSVNLNNGAYTFAATAGTFDNRFELRYTNSALSNTAFNLNTVIMYVNNIKDLIVKSTGHEISSVALYDITGRLLLHKSEINNTWFTANINAFASQIILVQVTDVNGKIITKKMLR